MDNETNKELYQHLFGRGWAWAMLKKVALDELIKRSDYGDSEATSYLRLYTSKMNVPKRPKLVIKYKFIH
ncbi:hypothetical protein HC026_02585 [Lactobacillus sp. LC28-10]|uniref:Uncharacterized protein n=1 Tax=Secundilactobacillus angelensis TaxID=2722706 RepID=A0ABX1KV36_9LACO|nr:hypothetical protein [Secundilactobacillus angelensis]MCH5461384.1 hypothetical protein [Secundilactobacillus angelensis]NLR17803.1 hypothetical protein [Secundilactobacillus angelensis]